MRDRIVRWQKGVMIFLCYLWVFCQPIQAQPVDFFSELSRVFDLSSIAQIFNSDAVGNFLNATSQSVETRDRSIQLLDHLVPGLSADTDAAASYFGGILNSQLGIMFGVFSSGLIFIMLLISGHSLLGVVLETAVDGDYIGKSYRDRYFMLMRTSIAGMLFFPLPQGYPAINSPGGFSLVQFFLYYVAYLGVQFANSLWWLFSLAMLVFHGGVGHMLADGWLGDNQLLDQRLSRANQSVQHEVSSVFANELASLDMPQNFSQNVPRALFASLLCARSLSNDGNIPLENLMVNGNKQLNFTQGISSNTSLNTGETLAQQVGISSTNLGLPCASFTVSYPSVSTSLQPLVNQMVDNSINSLVMSLYQISLGIGLDEIRVGCDRSTSGSSLSAQGDCLIGLRRFSSNLRRNAQLSQITMGIERAVYLYYRYRLTLARMIVSGNDQSTFSYANIGQSLVKGGWSQASNHYFYYARGLGKQTQSVDGPSLMQLASIGRSLKVSNGSFFCNNSNANAFICEWLFFPQGQQSYKLRLPMQSLSPPNQSQTSPAPNVVNNLVCDKDCYQDISKCCKFLDAFGNQTAAGQFQLGAALNQMLSGFQLYQRGQFSTPAQTFAELEANGSICGVGFAPSNCEDKGSFTSNTWNFLTSMSITIVAGMAGLVAQPMRVLWLPIAIYDITSNWQFLTMGFSGNMSAWNPTIGLFLMFDPQSFLSHGLQQTIHSFVYWLATAWYDTFIVNKQNLYYYPVESIADFGFRTLKYSVAYLVQVGVESFTANYELSMRYFSAKLQLEIINRYFDNLGRGLVTLGQVWRESIPRLTPTAGIAQISKQMVDSQAEWQERLSPFFGEVLTNVLMVLLYGVNLAFTSITAVLSKIVFTAWILPIWKGVQTMLGVLGLLLILSGKLLLAIKTITMYTSVFAMNEMAMKVMFFINNQYLPIYLGVAIPLIVVSTLYAFFIPMYPNLIYALGVMGWLLLYLEAMIAAPLILLGLANPKGHPLLGTAQKTLMLFLAVLLRPSLILLGFLFSLMILSIAMILFYSLAMPLFNQQVIHWFSTVASGSDSIIFSVLLVMGMIMYVYMMYQIVLYSFSMTYVLPNRVMSWLGLMLEQGEEERLSKELADNFKNVANQMGGGGKEVSSKGKSAGGIFPNAG